MPEAGRATVRFVGDYSSLMSGLTASLAPGKMKKAGLVAGGSLAAGFVASKVIDEFVKAVDVTKQFDKDLSSLAAVSGATEKQLSKLRVQAIEMGAATTFSASEAAKAQVELAKGGLSASQILGGSLKASLNLAAAGELDLAQAAETTVNAMQLFDMQGRQTSRIADMLATAANTTTADVEDFAMALKQGGSVAKLAGYDLNDTVIVLEALAEAGIKNSDAGTSMKAAFLQLINPSKKQAKLAEELKIHWVDQNGELKNAVGISKELRTATVGMTKAERAKTLGILAGQDGIRTLNALYMAGEQQLRKYSRRNLEQGTAADTARIKTDNLAGDVEQLSGAYETLQIKLGTAVTPALRELMQAGTDSLRWINNFSSELDKDALGTGESWNKVLKDSVTIVKEMATMPFDPLGSARDLAKVFGGDEEEISRLQAATDARRDAVKSLRRSSLIAKDARERATEASKSEQRAEQNLRRSRQRFGDGSEEVLRAEIRLQRAKQRTISLTRAAKRAERLEGVERQVVASRTRDQVVQEKARINVLNRQIRTLGRKREVEIRNNGYTKAARDLEDQIIKKIKGRDNSQKRLNNVLSDAARQIGPKYAKVLQQINGRSATFEAALGRLPKKANSLKGALGQLPPATEKVGRTAKIQFGKAEDSVGDYAEALNNKRRQINSNMRTMPTVQTAATDRMIQDFAQKMGALGNGGAPQQKRLGGVIQHFRDGGVPVAVSPGEFFKTPDGRAGIVPGRPTAADNVLTSMPVGTKVFTFDGQRRLMEGATDTEALRKQAPHFADGGIVHPTISGGSPKARKLGQAAVDKVHSRAVSLLPKVAGSNIVEVGRNLQRLGYEVGENPAFGGVAPVHTEGSYHYQGRAIDVNDDAAPFGHGSSEKESLDWLYQQLRKLPHAELIWQAPGHYDHLHFAMAKGGVVKDPWFNASTKKGNINGVWPSADLAKNSSGWYALPTLPGYVIGALAEAAGQHFGIDVPGRTMMQMVMGEGASKPGSQGTDPGGRTKGYGLWAVTTSYNDDLVKRFGGSYGAMNNPVLNAAAMAHIYRDQGTGAWYGDKFVTDSNAHWSGNYDLRNALGGIGYAAALKSAMTGEPVDTGMSDKQKEAARDSKARQETREKRIKALLSKSLSAESPLAKKGILWQILEMYANFGEFDSVPGKTDGHGGVVPGVNEAAHLLTRAGQIAAIANPNRGAGQLYSLVKWLGEQVEMTGVEDADEHLAKKLENAKAKGGKVSEARQKKKFKKMARFGENFPWGPALNANEDRLALIRELIQNAEHENTAQWSAGGTEYTQAEVDQEITLNRSLLGRLDKKHVWLNNAIPYVENVIDDYKRKIEKARKNPAERWKIDGYKKGLAAAQATLNGGVAGTGLKQSLVDLIGATGQGGEWAEVVFRLKELGVTETTEGQKQAGISIGDLTQIVEAAKYGVYDRLPKFHDGGTVSGSGHEEVMALVKSRESIYTQRDNDRVANALAANGSEIKVIVNGDIVTDHEDPVEVVIGDQRFKAEVRKEVQGRERAATQLMERGVQP